MAWYRKIDPRMWNDAKFRCLSTPEPNAQTLWLYLLTGPCTEKIPGIILRGKAALAEEIGWETEAFDKAFSELSSKGMAKASWKDRLIILPNTFKYNPPENPNVLSSWLKYLDFIPECELKNEYINILKEFLKGYRKGFLKAFNKGYREGLDKGFGNTGTGAGTGAGAGTGDKYYREKFELFFSEYECEKKGRCNKKESWEGWRARMKDGINPDDLIQASRNYHQQQDPKYIMASQRFLNGKENWRGWLEAPKKQLDLEPG